MARYNHDGLPSPWIEGIRYNVKLIQYPNNKAFKLDQDKQIVSLNEIGFFKENQVQIHIYKENNKFCYEIRDTKRKRPAIEIWDDIKFLKI